MTDRIFLYFIAAALVILLAALVYMYKYFTTEQKKINQWRKETYESKPKAHR